MTTNRSKTDFVWSKVKLMNEAWLAEYRQVAQIRDDKKRGSLLLALPRSLSPFSEVL